MQKSSRAIILKRVAYGEADWIVTLFLREGGRITGIARSARKSKRRFAGALEPGAVVDVRYSEGRGGGLVRLDEASPAFPIHGVLRSLGRIEALSRALRVALAFLQEGEANPAKFDLLVERIMALSEREPDPFESAAFELRWLALCGYAPSISECVLCGHAVGARAGVWRMSYEKGGLVCPRCALGVRAAHAVDGVAMEGLASLAGDRAPGDASGSLAAGAILVGYMDHVLGRPIEMPKL